VRQSMVEAATIKRDRSSNVCLELFVSFDLPVNGSAQLRYLSVWRGHGFSPCTHCCP
jgi:hypothetical protein